MADSAAVGDLHLATVVVNVRDMQRAVQFWNAALATSNASSGGIRSS
ncbi:MAG: hypothetical protein M3415_07740 [Actinomycetota bacterium]|jgi:hypothetical protein|nr:hypothetical protein [Actinomycetota bacterium]